jgi:hypothetical protein
VIEQHHLDTRVGCALKHLRAARADEHLTHASTQAG